MLRDPRLAAAVAVLVLAACVDFAQMADGSDAGAGGSGGSGSSGGVAGEDTAAGDPASDNECQAAIAKTKIDGDFSPGEWVCATPLAGKFSFLYARVEGQRLHVLNDWVLRDVGAVPACMYNLFAFSTGGGSQSWQVKVWGSGAVDVLLNGSGFAFAKGASGFHASPNKDAKHAIFEFLLGDEAHPVLSGAAVFKNKDPDNQTTLTCGPCNGCTGSGSDDWLVDEEVQQADLLPKGQATDKTNFKLPKLVAFGNPNPVAGKSVTAIAGHLGAIKGSLYFGAAANGGKLLAWGDSQVQLQAPTVPGVYSVSVKTAAGIQSNSLILTVKADPDTLCASQPDGAPCSDDSVCTQGDHCGNGLCIPGADVDCADKLPCTFDACDAKEGCTHAAATGTDCDDGNACVVGETCQSNGACSGGTKLACDDGQPCTDDYCDNASGCNALPTAEGAPCQDGNFCTDPDGCAAGKCKPGPPPNCDDGNVCTFDKCVATAGCKHSPEPGGICDDGDACTGPDFCYGSGTCSGKATKLCNDNNPCTQDKCDSKSGCSNLPVANTPPCSDGNACTTGDTCIDGICTGTPVPPKLVGPCEKSLCDTATGQTSSAALSGTPCEDGKACTAKDTCVDGLCKPGPVQCDDGISCTADTCNAQGNCQSKPLADGAVCDDGEPCTTQETCTGGACKGSPLNCDDGDPKTADKCVPGVGCVFVPK